MLDRRSNEPNANTPSRTTDGAECVKIFPFLRLVHRESNGDEQRPYGSALSYARIQSVTHSVKRPRKKGNRKILLYARL